jgi:hypothetical protein
VIGLYGFTVNASLYLYEHFTPYGRAAIRQLAQKIPALKIFSE